MGRKNSSNRRCQLPSYGSTNVMPGYETETSFVGSVSNYSMEQLVSEPTGAKAVLGFVVRNTHDRALALPVEAPLCDSDHRGLGFTSSTGAPQAKYATAIVLSFKKSYAEVRRLVKKKLERSAKRNSNKQHGNF